MNIPPGRRLSAKEKNEIVSAVRAVYRREPDKLRQVLPKVAELLGGTGLDRRPSRFSQPHKLTELERGRRIKGLHTALAAHRREPSFSHAVEALEDALALIEDGQQDLSGEKPELLRILRKVTGLSLSTKGKLTSRELGSGEPVRAVLLIRGVVCHLTWDSKLVSVDIDPKALLARKRALQLTGLGHGNASDVSERHDDYLTEAFSG